MADDSGGFDLVASFFTLTGAGFGEEPRYSFVERCRAAAAAGFTGIGLHADDLPRTVASGLDVAGMQAVLADTGLRVVEIEFLGGWALDDRSGRAGVAQCAGSRRWRMLSVVGMSAPASSAAASRSTWARREDGWRSSPDDSRDAACRSPWRRSPGPCWQGPTAVPELLRQVQAPNLGQMVDVWHFFNNGGTPDALTGPIAAVQLNDGPRVHGDYLVHARAARRLPGEGELDVAGLLRAVLRNGFTGPWCVEVNTPEFRALPVGEAARRAAAAAAAALDAAGAPRTRA